MSESESQQLRTRLVKFGLNPKEWILVKLNDLSYAIFQRTNPKLVFAGAVQKFDLGWDWVHLELVEI